MTQIAKVVSVPERGVALVRVERKTACGHDCENCAGCGVQGTALTVRALCSIDVEPGDIVEVFSGKQVLAFAALVYILPLVLFLAGYLIPSGLSESVRYLFGGIGFALGLVLAVICDRMVRRKNTVTYQIRTKL